MRMNDAAKLNFALEHIAHLEDYINDEWHPELQHKLKRIKEELEKHHKTLQSKGRVVL